MSGRKIELDEVQTPQNTTNIGHEDMLPQKVEHHEKVVVQPTYHTHELCRYS